MSLKIQQEVKVESEPCVIAWDNNSLFVGAEDGSIKAFDANLTPGTSWPAHKVQLFALTAGDGKVFSSSNDGFIRVWTPKGEKVTEIKTDGDTGILHVFGKELYAGDDAGNVFVYQDNELKAAYNVLEEVKDLWLKRASASLSFLFTVRDTDVTVTEIKPNESQTFVTIHTMEGRAPLRVTGDRLLVMARGGNDLQLFDATIETKFKKLHTVKASDMIVTSLAVSGDYAYTGGWDGTVRRWKVDGDVIQPAGEVKVGATVAGMVAVAPDRAYAVVGGGRVVQITPA